MMPATTAPTAAALAILVDRFYEQVRRDPELGPVFNPAVHDWAAHKRLLTSFWSSVALGGGTYRGNPMAAHQRHAVRAEHFDRWLSLWRASCTEVLEEPAAMQMIGYAERIGHSLMRGLGLRSHSRRLGVPVLSLPLAQRKR